MKMAVFWVVAIALMMEAARTSETLVNFYQTTQRYNPEDNHLRTHRRENLKSYLWYDLTACSDNSLLKMHVIEYFHSIHLGFHMALQTKFERCKVRRSWRPQQNYFYMFVLT
jgi:hypothetical protein